MELSELRGKYAGLINEAKALIGEGKNPEATAKMGEADLVWAQLQIQKRVEEANSYLAEPAGTVVAQNAFRPSAPDEGNDVIDGKSWREFEIKVAGEPKKFRYHVPLKVQGKGYTPAFESYLRSGKDQMGPNDRKALTEGIDSAGGYTVPEDWQATILKKIATMATVRNYARVISTSRDIVHWPRIKYTTNNEYTSGIRTTWTGETPSSATVHRVTDQVFGSIDIPINTHMASQLLSMDLIEDSAFDVLGISAEMMGEAFAMDENEEFWNGSGAGRPRGLITDASDTANFDAAVTVGGTADTFVAEEVIQTCYALPAQYERNARWFFSKSTEKHIRSFTDTSGAFMWPIINQVGQFGPAPQEILGFPVTRDEMVPDMSTTADVYPVVFGDLSSYVIADRVGLSIQRNDQLYSETNNVLLLARKRVGGQLAEAYKLSILMIDTST